MSPWAKAGLRFGPVSGFNKQSVHGRTYYLGGCDLFQSQHLEVGKCMLCSRDSESAIYPI